jgi:hypothetical protein
MLPGIGKKGIQVKGQGQYKAEAISNLLHPYIGMLMETIS